MSRSSSISLATAGILCLPATLNAQAQKPSPSVQPEFVLPFNRSVNASGVGAFSIVNLASGLGSFAIQGVSRVGVFGSSNAPKGGFGVMGAANGEDGVAVYGFSDDKGVGVSGQNKSHDNDGVRGFGLRGVRGTTYTEGGAGVVGVFREDASAITLNETLDPNTVNQKAVGIKTRGWLATHKIGVQGISEVDAGYGVAGRANNGENSVGVFGSSTDGYAGYFKGKVTITDHLLVKSIRVENFFAEKSLPNPMSKLFVIDHPLDPANKLLRHASIESNEVKNLYDGVAVLDETGMATVTLPDWFEALNQDFRYQLTCIGGYAPVYIDQEIRNHRFRIAGGRRGLKVSWQITGVRNDAHARANPLIVEEMKAEAERGRYLSPIGHGKPASAGIHSNALSSDTVRPLQP